ncbi:MAG: hypothetical protein E8D46_17080 [Nitrospira sp.]|nr:hypothetical protein [Nitrospira sp.]TKB71834.1 MAG: hypothetical protein E8D46_17080 [Nitrospira sp.]
MSEHDLEKLLGGFAADTLTPEEKQALYTAALQDQQLFNAIADEQAFKELLSNPAVRRRLLASLEQKSTTGADGSLSWLDWFRRPAGFALAGGLTAAALSLVLGVRIYQDSLRQAAQSTATDEAIPLPPSVTPQAKELRAKTKENLDPSSELPERDMLVGKLSMPERAASPPSKKEQTANIGQDRLKQRSRQDEFLREAKSPAAGQEKLTEEVASLADQKLVASPTPSTTAPEPRQRQTPASGQIAGTVTPIAGARALFYGGETTKTDTRLMAKEQTMKPLAESSPQAGRLERPLEGPSQVGTSGVTAAQPGPLGLRYSFVVRGTDGQDQEVDAGAASTSIQPVFLTVEANQDAYVQIWKIVGSSTPQPLWPQKETGQSSLKISPGQRQQVPLAKENGPITLTVHLARIPLGLFTKREIASRNRLSLNQLQESITPSGAEKSPERATYVINQDSSLAQITIDLILDR